MLKKYIQGIVKSELAKQKLNSIYGLSRSYNLNTVNDEERQQFNKQISQLNDEKFKLNQQLFNSYGDRYELQVLKQENQKLKESLEKQKQRQYETNEFWSLQKHEEELEKLKKENEMLKESIEKIDGKLILKGNLLSEQRGENEKLKNSLKGSKNKILELKKSLEKQTSYRTIDYNATLQIGSELENLKQENENLKKELRDSKNGLNGANHVIKNNKEWINQQDKKIKELEEKTRCLKSDKEDLQYNLRRKSTQKIQLESKNKSLEEKLSKISSAINPVRNASLYGLMCTIDTIRSIIKES